MDLTKEIIELLRKAMETKEYFSPFILAGIRDALEMGDPDIHDNGFPDDIDKWIDKMWSR